MHCIFVDRLGYIYCPRCAADRSYSIEADGRAERFLASSYPHCEDVCEGCGRVAGNPRWKASDRVFGAFGAGEVIAVGREARELVRHTDLETDPFEDPVHVQWMCGSDTIEEASGLRTL